MPNSSIRPIDRILSDATTPDQIGPGSNASEEGLDISQSFSITVASQSDCLASYPGHRLGSLIPLQRCIRRCILQPKPTGPTHCRGLTPLQRCSRCILQPQPTGPTRWRSLTSLQRCSRCILQPMQTGPTRWGSFTPLQRCNRCILQPQTTWPTRW